jgi:hypothetical protein
MRLLVVILWLILIVLILDQVALMLTEANTLYNIFGVIIFFALLLITIKSAFGINIYNYFTTKKKKK